MKKRIQTRIKERTTALDVMTAIKRAQAGMYRADECRTASQANAERAERGRLAMVYYRSLPGMDPKEILTDLLSDLMHAARTYNFQRNFQECLRIAEGHFEIEVREARWEKEEA